MSDPEFHSYSPRSAPAETQDARQRRLAREAEQLEQARRELQAGQGLSEDEVEAWFEAALDDSPALSPRPR